MNKRIRTHRSTKLITGKFYPVYLLVLLLSLLVVTIAYAANIDTNNKWAYVTNVGWINFNPTHGGGNTVYDDHLEGYAWAENIGWIRLGTHEGGGAHTYANTAADNYGVNHDGAGNLSGYAWGTNVGWINFNPTHSQVTIDTATGSFDGYAWGENIGWIHFKNTTGNAYNVVTTWRPVGAGAGAADGVADGDDADGDKKIFNIGAAGGIYRFGPVRVFISPGTVDVDCRLVIWETASGNFKLGNQVYDIKLICGGQSVTQLSKPIQVCVKPRDGVTAGKQLFHQPSGTNQFGALPLSDGPAGYVCGDTSRLSLFALGKLQLPNTGFAPGVVTDLSVVGEQTAEKMYVCLGDSHLASDALLGSASQDDCHLDSANTFRLKIPILGLDLPIVGVPLTGRGWDVTWLDDQAGYLEGTAYPTWAGNTAITAHVWDRDNNPGPFVELHTLQHGDQIIIHAWKLRHVYEVRKVMQVKPDTLRALPHSDYDMLTLITCKDYNESNGEYDWRIAVQAVLITIE